MSKVDDLWPDDLVSQEVVKTPVAVLQEQASILSGKMKNVVVAHVEGPERTNDYDFSYSFYLVGPALNNYAYRLFIVKHSIELYPLYVDTDRETFKSLKERKDFKTTVYTDSIRADNEEEFKSILREVFKSNKAHKVITGILSQSQSRKIQQGA